MTHANVVIDEHTIQRCPLRRIYIARDKEGHGLSKQDCLDITDYFEQNAKLNKCVTRNIDELSERLPSLRKVSDKLNTAATSRFEFCETEVQFHAQPSACFCCCNLKFEEFLRRMQLLCNRYSSLTVRELEEKSRDNMEFTLFDKLGIPAKQYLEIWDTVVFHDTNRCLNANIGNERNNRKPSTDNIYQNEVALFLNRHKQNELKEKCGNKAKEQQKNYFDQEEKYGQEQIAEQQRQGEKTKDAKKLQKKYPRKNQKKTPHKQLKKYQSRKNQHPEMKEAQLHKAQKQSFMSNCTPLTSLTESTTLVNEVACTAFPSQVANYSPDNRGNKAHNSNSCAKTQDVSSISTNILDQCGCIKAKLRIFFSHQGNGIYYDLKSIVGKRLFFIDDGKVAGKLVVSLESKCTRISEATPGEKLLIRQILNRIENMPVAVFRVFHPEDKRLSITYRETAANDMSTVACEYEITEDYENSNPLPGCAKPINWNLLLEIMTLFPHNAWSIGTKNERQRVGLTQFNHAHRQKVYTLTRSLSDLLERSTLAREQNFTNSFINSDGWDNCAVNVFEKNDRRNNDGNNGMITGNNYINKCEGYNNDGSDNAKLLCQRRYLQVQKCETHATSQTQLSNTYMTKQAVAEYAVKWDGVQHVMFFEYRWTSASSMRVHVMPSNKASGFEFLIPVYLENGQTEHQMQQCTVASKKYIDGYFQTKRNFTLNGRDAIKLNDIFFLVEIVTLARRRNESNLYKENNEKKHNSYAAKKTTYNEDFTLIAETTEQSKYRVIIVDVVSKILNKYSFFERKQYLEHLFVSSCKLLDCLNNVLPSKYVFQLQQWYSAIDSVNTKSNECDGILVYLPNIDVVFKIKETYTVDLKLALCGHLYTEDGAVVAELKENKKQPDYNVVHSNTDNNKRKSKTLEKSSTKKNENSVLGLSGNCKEQQPSTHNIKQKAHHNFSKQKDDTTASYIVDSCEKCECINNIKIADNEYITNNLVSLNCPYISMNSGNNCRNHFVVDHADVFEYTIKIKKRSPLCVKLEFCRNRKDRLYANTLSEFCDAIKAALYFHDEETS